jgi:hypothetical protein
LSGNGNNGTLVNGPTYESSSGGAITFDGSNDYAGTSYTASFNDFSLQGFAKASAPAGKDWEDIIDSYDLDSSDWCRIGLYTGKPTFEIDASSVRASVRSTTVIPSNTWFHIAGVRNGSTGYLYVNGVLNKQATVTTNTVSADTDSQFFIGNISRTSNLSEGWNGQIAAVSIYNRALTANEVAQNFAALRGRYGI